MTAKLCNVGRLEQLTTLKAELAPDFVVGLYTAPNPPTVANVAGDFTPATFPGYAAQAWAGGAPSIDGNGNALSAASTLTFTRSSGAGTETILGYFVLNTASGIMHYFEQFTSPVVISSAGQSIQITPNWYLGEVTPPL